MSVTGVTRHRDLVREWDRHKRRVLRDLEMEMKTPLGQVMAEHKQMTLERNAHSNRARRWHQNRLQKCRETFRGYE
jgi:hypothetical protein